MRHAVVLLVTAFACTFAQAHNAGDWIVKAGPISVQPRVDSDPINVAGLATFPKGVDIGNETQLGLTGAYMVTDKWGIELLAATPFKHEITLKDAPVKVGDTKHLPPTVSLQYYPEFGSERFHPYVGLGVNATIFFEEDVSDEMNSALDDIVALPAGTVNADLELEKSFGLSTQLGFDYMLADELLLSGAVWWIDIDTEATLSTAVADVKFDVEIDPVVYFLSIGYKF
jgi:outer membrane protein